MRKFFFVLLWLPLVAIAQTKQITLEDIYKNKTFAGEPVQGFIGEKIDSFVNSSDVKDESGKLLSIGDYLLSNDKKRMLVFTGRESIYRRSSKSFVYLH